MALEQPGTPARQQACQEFSKVCLHSRHCKEVLTSFRSTDWPNLACKLAGHASKADKDLWHRSKPYFGTSVLVLFCSLPTHTTPESRLPINLQAPNLSSCWSLPPRPCSTGHIDKRGFYVLRADPGNTGLLEECPSCLALNKSTNGTRWDGC